MSSKTPTKCSHPRHEEYSKMKEEIVYEEKNGKLSVLGTDWLKTTYVKSPKYGLICLNCVCYEVGRIIEKYPISDFKTT